MEFLMRLFFTLLVVVIQVFLGLPRRNRPLTALVLVYLALVLGCFQLFTQGFLWFLMPSYGLLAYQSVYLVIFWTKNRDSRPSRGLLGGTLGVLRGGFALILILSGLSSTLGTVIFPLDGPPPTGPWSAAAGLFKDGNQKILLVYPVEKTAASTNTQGFPTPRAYFPWESHLESVRTLETKAPQIPREKMSLVIFYPTDQSKTGDYLVLARELASWGLVCVLRTGINTPPGAWEWKGVPDAGALKAVLEASGIPQEKSFNLEVPARKAMAALGMGFNGRTGILEIGSRISLAVNRVTPVAPLVLGAARETGPRWSAYVPGSVPRDWTEDPVYRPWLGAFGLLSSQSSAIWSARTALIRDYLLFALRDGPSPLGPRAMTPLIVSPPG